ncbi:hypothetical protein RCK98_24345, partial [Salmonella enterica subsp. enterica serovar 1,4,[5],12:i:-]
HHHPQPLRNGPPAARPAEKSIKTGFSACVASAYSYQNKSPASDALQGFVVFKGAVSADE